MTNNMPVDMNGNSAGTFATFNADTLTAAQKQKQLNYIQENLPHIMLPFRELPRCNRT